MISSLTIKNFQCHSDLTIKFSKSVTVLVGDNGHGKSAAVRALRWLLLNEWHGKADQMTTWGEKETSVSAVTDKHTITRSKGPSGNLYVLDDLPPFEAVGAGKVPDAIAKIINISEENFQEQLDPAFWFHLTAGQVAKSLNKIVNLSSIDTSLENVARELRESREASRVSEQRLSEARNIKESLAWTRDADAALSILEQQEQQMARIEAQSLNLTRDLAQAEGVVRIARSAAAVIQRGEAAIEVGQEFYNLDNKIKVIRSLADSALTQETRVCSLQKRLKEAQDRLVELKECVCPTCHGRGYK